MNLAQAARIAYPLRTPRICNRDTDLDHLQSLMNELLTTPEGQAKLKTLRNVPAKIDTLLACLLISYTHLSTTVALQELHTELILAATHEAGRMYREDMSRIPVRCWA